MKMMSCVAALSVFIAIPVQAAENKGEVGYQTGELGYDALMAGDNQRAAEQILERTDDRTTDPAKLLNLGRAYQRLGRTADAIRLYQAAFDSRDVFDLELADGKIMSSREAARLALAQFNSRFASK
jgi:tetratricopeptide (TPR) repeat protein